MEKQPPLISLRYPFLELVLVLALWAFSCFFFLFLGLALASPVFHISGADLPNIFDIDKLNTNATYLSALKFVQAFSSLAFLAPALVFAFLMGYRNDYLKFNRTSYLIPSVFVIGIVVLSQPAVNFFGVINSHLQLPSFLSGVQKWLKASEDKGEAIQALFLQMPDIKELIINIIVIATIPAICEEAFFRGTLQQILVKWAGNKHVAVWITGAVFSALHMEFFGFLPRMMLGVVLGYIFLWSGNLWYSIIGHMVNNGLAVIAYYLYQAKIISFNPDSNDTGPAWVILVSSVLFIGLLFVYDRYFKHHPPGEEDIVEPEEG